MILLRHYLGTTFTLFDLTITIYIIQGFFMTKGMVWKVGLSSRLPTYEY